MFNFISALNPRNRRFFDLSIILLASILVTLPIFIYGIPGGPDMPQHFQFAYTFYESITNGTLYPSWALQPNFGYGDVSVRFYPPLTYYILAVFRWITGNWFDAGCLLVVFLFFISGIGVYCWSREWFSERASLLGAVIYLIIPQHVNQIYQASMIAEFTAAAILPFCFLFATRVCSKGRWIDVCKLGIAFGLLVLSHLPTLVMGSIMLLVYSLLTLKKADFIRTNLKLAASVSLGLLLSCFYWVRMFSELSFVQHSGEKYSTDYYSFNSHFIFPFLNIFSDVEPSGSGIFMNSLSLVTFGVLIPSLIIYFMKAKEKKIPSMPPLIVMTFLSFILATPISLMIWKYFPLLQKIQFPWRWLILFSLGCSIIAASSFETVLGYFKTTKRHFALLTIGLMLVCIPFDLTKIVNHHFYYPKVYFTDLVQRLSTSPSWECWWTIWAIKDDTENKRVGLPNPMSIPEKVLIGNRKTDIKIWVATERTFDIGAGEAGQATVATLYYPHWKATVNGQPVEVSPTENGLISFPAPAEKAEVRLYFQEPQRVQIAFYLSGLAWIIILGFFVVKVAYLTIKKE